MVLTIRNFKSIESLDLPLGKVNVLVGANASGKSSVLQAIDLVLDGAKNAHRFTLWSRRPELASLVRLGANASTIQLSGANYSAALTLPSPLSPGLEGGPAPWSVLLNPERTSMLKPIPVRDDPKIDASGAGLADAMAAFSDAQRRSVVEVVQLANPRISDFSLRRRKLSRQVLSESPEGLEAWTTRPDGVGFELVVTEDGNQRLAELLSDGTLWAFAIGAVLAQAPASPGSFLLVDDLDRDLHPQAQFEVARALRSLVEKRSDLTLVATAHSPFILNAFEAQEVFVLHRGSGRVSARALSAHPEWEKWSDQLRSGEFWSWSQEAWVGAAGEPA